jgi:phosphonopyruvate decarboxylase
MTYEDSLFDAFKKSSIKTFFSVPDSTLKNFLALLQSKRVLNTNVHESVSVAQAMGYQMATGSIPCIAIQNSGLGNIINPVSSLSHKEIYSIPLFFLIGWRGGPNLEGRELHDEPQHVVMGRATKPILRNVDIEYDTLSGDIGLDSQKIARLHGICLEQSAPVALIVPRGLLDGNSHIKHTPSPNRALARYEAIKHIIGKLNKDDLIVATTGMTSRELYELRQKADEKSDDFLTVGGMGLASQIAAGISSGLNGKRRVVVLDGDGAAQMYLGGMMELAAKKNLVHILLNNGVHDSVGGQTLCNPNLSYQEISETFGYDKTYQISSINDLTELDLSNHTFDENIFVEVLLKPGSFENIGRPNQTPLQTKLSFLRKLNNA